MNYVAWAERAKEFFSGLTNLAGEIESHTGIEPPGTDEYSLEWMRTDESGVPDEVKRFLAEVSKRTFLLYRWFPPHDVREKIDGIWPGRAELVGGGDLCELARYSTYDPSGNFFGSSIRETYQEIQSELGAEMPELFANVSDETLAGLFGGSDQGRAAGLVPFLILGDEARLSLHTGLAGSGVPAPVVYTPKDQFDDPQLISESFDQFLRDWEELRYLTPDLETLKPWLTGPEGQLDVSGEKTTLLQSFFLYEEELMPISFQRSEEGYGGWCARAENFARKFNQLPGDRGVSINIGPPAEAAAFDQRVAEFSYTLPETLRRFYLEGSGDFQCSFHWRLNVADRKEIESIIPHQYTLYGGGEIVSWDKLSSEPGYYCYWEEEEEDACTMGRLAIPVWQMTVPLIIVGNGDVVGFYVGPGGDQEKVVYLCHDEPGDSVTILKDSLARFFEDWEGLCYAGPDLCHLACFLENEGIGPLKVDSRKSLQFRRILLGEDS